MARRNGRQKSRVQRLLPCLGRDFVMIPVTFNDLPPSWLEGKNFVDAVLAAGAVEVIHGGVRGPHLEAALGAQIDAGHLPEDAWKLLLHIEVITVFCHVCVEDIQCVVKRIEDEIIPESGPLKVDYVFIGYKMFKKDILYLGMLAYKCYSPRHSRLSSSLPEQHSTTTSATSNLWDELDKKIAFYYKQDTELTQLNDTTYQELSCTVYRLFVNKQFLIQQSLDDGKGNLAVCRTVNSSKYSTLIVVLLKMLQRLKSRLISHFSQPSGLLKKIVTCSDLCKEEMRNILTRVADMDVDGSLCTFVSDLGLGWADFFQAVFLSAPDCKLELQYTILELIERERGGVLIDEKLLRDAIEVLKGCPLYEYIVERPYMSSLSRHYSCLSRRLIQTINVAEYLKKIESHVEEEIQLAMKYMGTKAQLNEIRTRIEKEMVGDHIARLVDAVDSHLCHLISVECYDDISRLFSLVRKLPGGYASLSTALTSYMRRSLSVLVDDRLKTPIEYIQHILDERDRYEKIIRRSLGKDMRLISRSCFILREITSGNFQLPEYLSLYMDHILALELPDYQVVNAVLDKAITLVSDFDNKAAFEIYYQRHLADRLLSGSYSEKMEMDMLLKLRGHCCPHYLKKLEIMISDIKNSQEVMRGFYESNSFEDTTHICAHILTANVWPQQPFTVCKLPVEIKESWDLFCSYYLSLHCGRKLDLCPSWGNAVISAKFGGCDREYKLVMPMSHMCVLMLFNSVERLSLDEIQKEPRIPRTHLVRCLSSPACVEGRNVLRKEPEGQITRNDHFSVNEQFWSKSDQLKFGTVIPLKSAKVILDKERSTVIDSLIVKLLKERPTEGLRFNSIVKGLAKLLKTRFCVIPGAVQKRLDSLISWEYVNKEERDGILYFRYSP